MRLVRLRSYGAKVLPARMGRETGKQAGSHYAQNQGQAGGQAGKQAGRASSARVFSPGTPRAAWAREQDSSTSMQQATAAAFIARKLRSRGAERGKQT